jgi:hypothetical protein
LLVVLGALTAFGQGERYKVGEIEFFGSEGLDLERTRDALPVHEGDQLTEEAMPVLRQTVERAVRDATGHQPTDVELTCCDARGGLMIFIGLGGGSSRSFAYNPTPKGAIRLPSTAVALYTHFTDVLVDSVRAGQAAEDDSKGYALAFDARVRAVQLEMRTYALAHEPLVRRVLASSSDAGDRAAAAHLLGYARSSSRQIAALVRASRDPDDDVRNNAVRALGVLARSDPKIARRIPAIGFVDMLSSGIWKDRNKASMLLDALSLARDRRLLAMLRERAMASLVEMARWRSHGHASAARAMLGRIAGIDETRLEHLLETDQVDTIIAALPSTR